MMDCDRLMRMIAGEVTRLQMAGLGDAKGRGSRAGGELRQQKRASIPMLQDAAPPLPPSDVYCLNDFLVYHDEDFIRNAYRGLLKREPDGEGFFRFLGALRGGEFAKVEILGRVRFSPEGRRVGVRVKGLVLPFAVRTIRRVPLFGRIVGVAQYLWRLPDIARTHERFEAAYFERELELRRCINRALGEITRTMEHVDDAAAARAAQERTSERVDGLKLAVGALQQDVPSLRSETMSFREEVARLRQSAVAISDALEQLTAAFAEQVGRAQARDASILAVRSDVDAIAATRPIQRALLGTRNARWFDELYRKFEDRFRGTRQEIRERVQVYVPVVRAANAGVAGRPVLDLGCGRGEWLELLRDNGLIGRGVDLNPPLVKDNRDRGLDVIEADILSALAALDAESVGAVTGMHIIEHLSTEELLQLIAETLRVLAPGGVAVFETPNPENLIVGASTFYTDLTHERPLPPHTMKFLLEACGFRDVCIMRMHPAPDEQHLDAPETFRARLNHLLFGPMDYAVVGRKQ